MLIVIIIDASFLDFILNVLKEGAFIFSHSTFDKSKSKSFFNLIYRKSRSERERKKEIEKSETHKIVFNLKNKT